MSKYAGIFLFGVFISSVAQVLLKKSAMKKYHTVWQEYVNPLVIVAYFLLVSATLLSATAYQGIPLSMGPVLEASGYFYISYFGAKIFKEKTGMKKIVALGMIIAGIFVYSFWGW